MAQFDFSFFDEFSDAACRKRVVIAAKNDWHVGRLSSHLTNDAIELRRQQKRLDHLDVREFRIPVHVSVANHDFLSLFFWILDLIS